MLRTWVSIDSQRVIFQPYYKRGAIIRNNISLTLKQ